MSPTLHQVALGVADLHKATQFYSDVLGLPQIRVFDPPGLAFYQIGPTRLLLELTSAPQAGSSVLYLGVTAIEKRYEELRAQGVDFSGPPQLIHLDADGDFGPIGSQEWMAFFQDPDGNQLALVESRLPSVKTY